MAAEQQPVVPEIITGFDAASTLDIERNEKPQDECGVFGIYAPGEAVITKTIAGMEGVQHRGHSGAGIAYIIENAELPPGKTQKQFVVHKGLGRVRDAIREVHPRKEGTFKEFDRNTGEPIFHTLEDSPWRSYDSVHYDKEVGSRVAMGHTRYSTAETEDLEALHPHLRTNGKARFALEHNGNIDNMHEVALMHGMLNLLVDPIEALEKGERIPTDTEDLATILDATAEKFNGDIVEAMKAVLPDINGAYCLVVMQEDKIIAARDPWGFHPLVLGRLPGRVNGHVVVSEEVVLPEVGAEYLRDVAPGEIVVLDEKGITTHMIAREEEARLCAFEGIYTAREDGIIDGISVRQMRYNLGCYLGEDQPADADIVVPIPDSGVPAGEGYSATSGIPVVMGIEKRHGSPRTFQLRGDKRAAAIQAKYDLKPELLEGQRVVLVDDSMIKGHTMKALVQLARDNGATEVHVRLSSAEYRKPCHMGMDTHDEWRLIASRMNTLEMAQYIGADSVAFNAMERVQQAADAARVRPPAIGQKAGQLCVSCVNGEYPFPLPSENRVVTLPLPKMRDKKSDIDIEIPLPA